MVCYSYCRDHALHPTQPLYRVLVLVQRLIVVRTAILVWECIHDVTPVYLHESCVPVRHVHDRPWSRSASTGSTWQEYKHQSDRQRSFAFYGATVWNSLSSGLCDNNESVRATAENSSLQTVSYVRHRCGVSATLAPFVNAMTHLHVVEVGRTMVEHLRSVQNVTSHVST